MTEKKYRLLMFLLWLVGTVFSQQYSFINYSLSEGLPQSQVFAMMEDSRGYIWFGTQGGGLSRFDGEELINFSVKDGLPDNYINAICEDSAEMLWIGTSRGMCSFDSKNFHSFKFLDKKTMSVTAIAEASDTSLWVGTDRGLYKFYEKSGKFEEFYDKSLRKSFVNTIYKSDEGVWIGTRKGGFLLDVLSGKLVEKNLFSGNSIEAFTEVDGVVFIATYENGVSLFDKNDIEIIETDVNSSITRPMCLFTEKNGNIWVGTEKNGVFIYQAKDSIWTNITEKTGLPNNHIRAIIQDSWENIWIATSGGGVVKYLGKRFTRFSTANGLKGNQVYDVFEDSKERIWLSAANKGISVLDTAGFRHYGEENGFINIKCKAIFEDVEGKIWIGTEGRGVVVFDTTGFRFLTEEMGITGFRVRAILQDSWHNIWIGTASSGILKLTQVDTLKYQIKKFTKRQGLPDPYINSLETDNENRIWFVTRYGKAGYFLNEKVGKIYAGESGLPPVSLRSMAFDAHGNIFIGTAGEGIFYASAKNDSTVFKKIALSEKLSSKNIYLLTFDKQGNLWSGTEAGVDKIVFNEAGQVVDIVHFGRNEGFLGIETCRNASICDRKGSLWFGTMNGLMKHTPGEYMQKSFPPKIHFTEVSLFYKPLEETEFADWALAGGGIKKGLVLPYNKNHLGFEFDAVSQANPDKIKYSRRLLKNKAGEWSPFSRQQTVTFSNLSHGEYTFEVKSCVDENICSNPLSVSFTIEKPFWKEWWFRFVVFSIVAFTILGFYKNRISKIRQKEKAKREQLEMENRILQLEQKALQLQMNPHFIFNALNSIQTLVATDNNKIAREELNNFAKLMRMILTNSRRERISLREEIETLRKYLEIERFCREEKFGFIINYADDIDIDEIEIPTMILQPFVENSVIHGISHLPKGGRITINFSKKDNILKCEIEDNGVGRKKAMELRESTSPGHQSMAMEVTKERLEVLMTIPHQKSLVIEDVLDGAGNVAGTRVFVWLPVFEW